MNKSIKWINRQVRLGWLFLAGGLVVGGIGIYLERTLANPTFNPRIITAIGILLVGIAVSILVRYMAGQRSPQAAARLTSEVKDERSQLMRARAGNRAYWFSAALTYALLMWVSFASNGSLPALTGDTLWFCLAGVVVLPFGVYAASMLYDEKHI